MSSINQFKTERRLTRIRKAVAARQITLHLVLENIHDPHNVSAIYRTCDAVGVPGVSLLYTIEKFPKINKVTSASARKWVETRKFESTIECCKVLKDSGFKIFASIISDSAKSLYEIDWTQRAAIVLGNEHRGISKEMTDNADEHFYIPMHGMIESLNVSVAAAVVLYEAQRQRMIKNMYSQSELSEEEFNKMIDAWCEK